MHPLEEETIVRLGEAGYDLGQYLVPPVEVVEVEKEEEDAE